VVVAAAAAVVVVIYAGEDGVAFRAELDTVWDNKQAVIAAAVP
jgi:hypothetical protein